MVVVLLLFPGNDYDQQNDDCRVNDKEYHEDDVSWYTGGDSEELEEPAYTVSPSDDPELLDQFDRKLEHAEVSASKVYASASRSFLEACELLWRVKRARGDFPLFGIGAAVGLAQPSTDRKLAKSRREGKKGKKKRETSPYTEGQCPNLGTPTLRTSSCVWDRIGQMTRRSIPERSYVGVQSDSSQWRR